MTEEQIDLHRQYVIDHGSDHDDGCPGDDTCDCCYRARNEAVNAACNHLAALRAAPTPAPDEKHRKATAAITTPPETPQAETDDAAWSKFLVSWVDYNLGKGHTDTAWAEFEKSRAALGPVGQTKETT